MADTVSDPDSVLTRYEDFKTSYRDTHTQCQAQGITFIPMVVEAVGGAWGQVARGVWSELAKTSALASGELQTDASCAIWLLQRLSMTLHRENARSCLKPLTQAVWRLLNIPTRPSLPAVPTPPGSRTGHKC